MRFPPFATRSLWAISRFKSVQPSSGGVLAVLTVAPLASGQARYYLSLAGNATGYYVDETGLEPEGRWYGPGAQEFGLSERVEADHLSRLCEGLDPHDPEKRLVRNALAETRKHGDDLCFSAPKSVSVAWALSSPELRAAIEKALHRAVRDALDYIQDTCGFARVGAQGQRVEPVPLAFALFEHASSRAGDPQLHVHAVCPNLTRHADGRTTAIDSTNFYHHMMAGGALFRASLAEGLRQLGFEIERDRGLFRIAGVDEALCERFSKRRAEIIGGILEQYDTLAGLSTLHREEILRAASGRRAELINLQTRRGKEERTRSELFAEWLKVAHELGIPEHYIEGLRREPRTLEPEEKLTRKAGVFEEGLKRMTEEYSHFAEKDLTRTLAEEAQGRGLSAREVRELVENKLASPELVRLGELITEPKNQERKVWRERSEERFTTPEVLEIEGRMLAAVGRLAARSAAVETPLVENLIASRERLSEEQANAVRHLVAGGGRIACLSGKAGTGKSTTLETCRLAWELSGKQVLGCALAGVAADELRNSAGIESDTLARILTRLEHNRLHLTKNHVVVLDEAGMVATKLMATLVREVEKAGAKLVLVGDAAQLQAIGAGGPFRSIAERVGQCELTQIRRQREAWRRQTVEQFSRGEAREALIAYVAKGQLHVTKTREEAITQLVERWKADGGLEKPEHCLLLASLNVEVKRINFLCQEERKAAGLLGPTPLPVGSDLIHEGDRVLLKKRSRPLGLENGFTAEVTALDHDRRNLTVRLDTDGREVRIDLDDYGAKNVTLGYASTVHKAQGRTVEHCHVLMGGPLSDKHIGYVQASRSRESTHLFLDQASAGPKLQDAIRSLARDRTKDLARDILDRNRTPEEAHPEPERRLRQGLSLGF